MYLINSMNILSEIRSLGDLSARLSTSSAATSTTSEPGIYILVLCRELEKICGIYIWYSNS